MDRLTEHRDRRLAAGDAVAAIREVRGRRRRAHAAVVEFLDSARRERASRTAAGMSSAGRPIVVRGPRPRDRTARRGGRGRRRRTRSAPVGCTGRDTRARAAPDLAQRGDRRLDHAELEPAVAGVHDADRVVARERDRRAVGGEHRERQAAHGGDRGVGFGGLGSGRLGGHVHCSPRAPAASTPSASTRRDRRHPPLAHGWPRPPPGSSPT